MEYRTLDVTVSSAEDLKAPRFGKLQPYAVVWLDRHDRRSTRVDKGGGRNPSWNERLSFAVPEHLLRHPGSSLHVEIHSKGSLMGSTLLGAAVIPLPDLVQQSEGNEVSMYQLRKKSGKVRGAVRLSVRVGEKMAVPAAAGYGSASDPVTAYPYDGQKMGYGGYAQGYPPQQQYQPYPQQGYYPPQQQGYYQQQQQYGRRPGRFGGMGGMGTGLAAGALGGLLVGDLLGDFGGGGFGGGGYGGGGYDGGGYDGGNFDNGGGGFDGGGFDGGGGGFDGGGFGGF